MLSISDQDLSLRRRQFLKIGGLGLGGLTLSQLLAAREAAGIGQLNSDRSVIFLFLHGGPSQTETFDPKPNAPAGIRSATGDIATSIPGLRFGASAARGRRRGGRRRRRGASLCCKPQEQKAD